MSTVSERIADWVYGTSYADFPPDAVAVAKRQVLDIAGVSIAAMNEPVVKIVHEYLKQVRGRKQSTVIGLGTRTCCAEAAFANGIIAHCLDYDDFCIPVAGAGGPHISAVVLPAAMALVEATRGTGKNLIEACVLGCEIAYRIGRGVEPVHYNLGWHVTGTEGILGATVAASKVLGLNRDQIANALGIAASEASGLRENFGTMTKPFHAAQAAAKAVKACTLAKLGFDSARTVFEGRYGFCRVFTQDAKVDEITRDLGQLSYPPEIILKPYPSCGASHTAIFAMLGLARQYRLRPEHVEVIEFESDPQLMSVLVYDKPKTGLEGKFSLQFVLALALVEKRVSLDQFTDVKVKDQVIVDLMNKVKVIPNLALRARDQNERPVILKIRLKDGQVVEKHTASRPGSRQSPITENDAIEKYRNCVSPFLQKEETEESIKLIRNLESLNNISPLLSVLVARKA